MRAVLNPIIELFAVEKARLWRGLSRSILGAAVALLAVLAALEGLMIVLVGGYASLIQTMQPWAAGLIVGGALMLVAVIVLAIVAANLRRRERVLEPPPVGAHGFREDRAAVDTPGLIKAAATEMIGKADIKVRDIALAALVAGLVLGVSPGLRRQLFGRRPRA
jgi:hypothetical protein